MNSKVEWWCPKFEAIREQYRCSASSYSERTAFSCFEFSSRFCLLSVILKYYRGHIRGKKGQDLKVIVST